MHILPMHFIYRNDSTWQRTVALGYIFGWLLRFQQQQKLTRIRHNENGHENLASKI